ncbi:IclR family transcriptional regulator [Eoetvoesiella caeni]
MKLVEPLSEDKAKGRIKSVGKVFEILNALASIEMPCRLSVLSRHINMPANVLRSYLVNLRDLGMVTQNSSTGLYDLGPELVPLGMAALRRFDLMKLARPVVEELSGQLNEPVTLLIWGDRGPIAIHSVERYRNFPYEVKIGSIVSVTATAAGRCFLAHLPPDRWEELVENERKEQGALVPNDTELKADLEAIRRSGLATRTSLLVKSAEAAPMQIKVLAAPVFGADRRMQAALAIISQDQAFKIDIAGSQAKAILAAAQRISKQLGYQVSDKQAVTPAE